MNKKLTLYVRGGKGSLKSPLFLTSVKAGFPSPADDYIEKKLDLNDFLIKNPPATFFVKVEGDSMKGAQISAGDILVVDRSIEPTDKKIVIAALMGEFTVKRIRIINKEIFLEAENPRYPSIKINENMDFEIFGVVTYVIHKAG